MVGAVIVSGHVVVGTGWHLGPGRPHAEAIALAGAAGTARGATAYVTLEPCPHHGRTPPCTEALIAAGVRRVVAAMIDPDPRVAGRGVHALRKAGVEVEVGVLAGEAERLNEAYLLNRLCGRPFVTYKAAVSLDGRIAAADGSSRWVTGEAAQRDVHRLRARCDAVCVGIGTVLADNPMLTVRDVRTIRQPLRVVADSRARTPSTARVLSAEAPTLIVVTGDAPAPRVRRLERAGAEVIVVVGDRGRLSVPAMLSALAERDVLTLLLEGGGTLAGSFAAAGLIDRFVLYLAPAVMGGEGTRSLLEGWAAPTITAMPRLVIEEVRRLGEDLRVIASPRREGR